MSVTVLAISLGLAIVLAFEIWMFVDAARNPRLSDQQRLLWCLGMLLIHPFVAIVYYFTWRSNLEV